MNWRKPIYFSYASVRGYRFPQFLAEYWQDWKSSDGQTASAAALGRLLRHCRESVPYYAELMAKNGPDTNGLAPYEELQQFPLMTKATIRCHFEKLKSIDLCRRNWSYNTSGGSTGEPVQFVQDREYEDRSKAITLLYLRALGYETGQPLVRLWGSERDIAKGTRSWRTRFFNWLTDTTWLNAFRMSPQRMRDYVATLNRLRPQLILAYAQAAYELASFVEREKLHLLPQRAVVTSAGTLYPFMRERIARVFGCGVYNFYGSREVSDIACELPGHQGLWVAPGGNYIEILDDDGRPQAPGEEGNIVVTCLTNYAMPLVRYCIGDRGALATPVGGCQILKRVAGRNVDVFRTRQQTLVDGEYFTHLLYFRSWVGKFQVIQTNYDEVLFRVVRANGNVPQGELDDIAGKVRLVMGLNCRVAFEFPKELPPHSSGKYRYTICELQSEADRTL